MKPCMRCGRAATWWWTRPRERERRSFLNCSSLALRGQAVYTVPTRALANDKLAEWRRRGWDVGIATGDLALHLDARVVVATLETQKGRLLRGVGPRLLVVDEYQMLADPVRGVNYEVSMALAPPETQLLLLSGSVGNPQDMVDWLRRIGRDAVLVSHPERPVPLTDVDLLGLPEAGDGRISGFWPRLTAEGACVRTSGPCAGLRAAAQCGRGAGAGPGRRTCRRMRRWRFPMSRSSSRAAG